MAKKLKQTEKHLRKLLRTTKNPYIAVGLRVKIAIIRSQRVLLDQKTKVYIKDNKHLHGSRFFRF